MSIDLIQEGIQAYKSGQKEKAVSILTEAVRQTPDSAWAWFWLGKALDEPEKKRYCYDRAMQIDPVLREKLKSPTSRISVATSSTPATTTTRINNLKPGKSRWKLFVIGGSCLCLVIGCAILGVLGVLNGIGTQSVQLLQNAQSGGSQPNIIKALTGRQSPTTTATPSTPTGTITHTPSPPIMRTRTPGRIPSSTPTSDLTKVYESLGFKVTEAKNARDDGQNDICIQKYDELLAQMPNWANGNFYRAVCKRRLAEKSHSLVEYRDLIVSGISDVDKAISIDPEIGWYYAEHSYQYYDLIEVYENSPADDALLQIALDNIQTSVRMGDYDENSQAKIPLYLIQLGRCQEGVDEAKRQIASFPVNQTPVIDLYDYLAQGYQCLGDYTKANQTINQRLKINKNCKPYMLQTSILIGLGQKNKALETIDRCINEYPSFGGYRYYLRSLLHWDRGEKDLARADNITGYGYTWYHGGLFAYMAGLILIDEGEQEAGLEFLKYAESSAREFEGPWLKKRIRASLASLNIPQQNPTPAATFVVTPIVFENLSKSVNPTQISTMSISEPEIPTQTPLSFIPPTEVPTQSGIVQSDSPNPESYEEAKPVDFNTGTGSMNLEPQTRVLYHFIPSQPIPVNTAREIHFNLFPKIVGNPTIQVSLWTKEGNWHVMNPKWGDNLVEFPSIYISSIGDTYMMIRNYSPSKSVHFDNASLLVTAELTDGEIKTYGR
jgi:tetratricopeptide (TPR) repeat protein